MKREISRRSFVLGGSIAAASVLSSALALDALAADGSASSAPTADSYTYSTGNGTGSMKDMTTGVDMTFYEPPAGAPAFVADPIDPTSIKNTEQFDVVICGAGLSGVSLALSAVTNGLKVVLIEKTDSFHTRGHDIGSLDSKMVTDAGITFDGDDYLNTALKECHYRCNLDIWKTWVKFNGEAVDWLADMTAGRVTLVYNDLGTPKSTYSGVDTWNDQINCKDEMQGLLQAMVDLIGENGGDIRYDIAACQLVQDESGTVTGVIAKDANGDYLELDGSKGVALCTGGYENNWDMLQKCLRPEDLCVAAWRLETTQNTGDGILMGEAIGGIPDPYPHVIMKDPGGSVAGHVNSKGLSLPFIRVNEAGHRFVNESMSPNYLSNAIMRQSGGHDFAILAGPDLATCIASTNYNTRSQSAAKMSPDELADSMKDIVITADTIDDLCQQTGIDADNLTATLQRVTELYNQGEDVDWGSDAKMFMDYSAGPYYALEESGAALVTVSGLRVTQKSEVIDKKGLPIPGLYALGNCSGDMFSDSYPHDLSGISHSRCVTFGYLLGLRLAGIEEVGVDEVPASGTSAASGGASPVASAVSGSASPVASAASGSASSAATSAASGSASSSAAPAASASSASSKA